MFRILEVPIYRKSPQQWSIEQEREKQKLFEDLSTTQENYWTREKVDSIYNERYDIGRIYNDIVGYITIEIKGYGKIFGDVFLKDAKSIKKNCKKPFKYRCKFFEEDFYESETNQEIFQEIIQALERAKKRDPKTKNKYLYLDDLNNIGPHIDWLGILFPKK